MTLRCAGIGMFFLVSCAAPPAGEGDAGGSDAGTGDAGDTADAGLVCTDGQIPGPLGTCVEPPCAEAGGACRTSSGCCQGMPCRGPLDPFGCGMCMRTEDECGEERACEEGFVCTVQPPPPCSCDGATWRACRPACPATACGEGESCREGWCQPKRCDEGATCPAGLRCAVSSQDADPVGCVRIACARDADCPEDAATCVNATCQPGAGSCALPVP